MIFKPEDKIANILSGAKMKSSAPDLTVDSLRIYPYYCDIKT